MAENDGYGLVGDGAIGIENGRIAWAGPASEIRSKSGIDVQDTIDLGGALVTPAFIDCHTHLVYGGNRAGEFAARLNGKSYEEIARAGGGIRSTVTATRAASEDELLESALPRLDAMIAEGVATVEIKSGYGLDCENELKMLRVARRLERERPVSVKTTLLAAHAVPPEFDGKTDDYVTLICSEILPAAKAENLADAVDGFCETIGFTTAQIEKVFTCATELGLPVKVHAEQLTNQGGARLAAKFNALSADHLEYLSTDDAKTMADKNVVAVMLPGAFYFLRDTQLPPIKALREAGVKMAVATDCNPGSSPLTSPLLAMNMACTLFFMTPEEALAGTTINAAMALGISAETGSISVGKRADLAIWDVDDPSELSYNIGLNRLRSRYFAGKP